MDDFDRTPPQDIAAEQSVLGGVLLAPGVLDEVMTVLDGRDFYRPAHETIYAAALVLRNRREPIDAVSMAAHLQVEGELAQVGGHAYLHTLINGTPTAANAGYYARIVRERAVLRRLVSAGTRVVQLGYATDGGDVDATVAAAVSEVMAVGESARAGTDRSLWDIADAALEQIDSGITCVPTPWAELNYLIEGWVDSTFVAIGARPKVGKALALDTPIPTPIGWTTMGEVKVGDHVIGADGKPARVTFATDVQHGRECFEVEFSDGAVIVADAEHLWETSTRASRKSEWSARMQYNRHRNQGTFPAVRTTREIAATLRVVADQRVNHGVRTCAPLDLPEADLPVDPYLLGIWLGDGASWHARIATSDPEIVTAFEDAGYGVRRVGQYDYSVTGGLWGALRGLNLLGQDGISRKHIPPRYMRASEDQRRALLAGLLDSDGYARPDGLVQFAVTSERLAREARELISTLGYRSNLTTKRVKGRREDSSTCYTVTFTPADKVFRLPRKIARQTMKESERSRYRMIVDVRPIKSVPVRCIQVDNADHLYLVGETCIPTHNTVIARQISRAYAEAQVARDKRVAAYFTLEMSAERLYQRDLAGMAGVPLRAMRRGDLTEAQWRAVTAADHHLRDLPMALIGGSGMTARQIAARCRALHREHPLGMVTVDHIGLVSGEGRSRGGDLNRQAELSDAADVFLALAHELACTVVVVTQLNRGVTQRADQRPVPSDIRDTDRIEQNADLLLMLHRDKDNHPEDLNVAVPHNRDGEEGAFTLTFHGDQAKATSPKWSPSDALRA